MPPTPHPMATIDDLFEPDRPFSDQQISQLLADPIEELYPWGPAPAELSEPGPLESELEQRELAQPLEHEPAPTSAPAPASAPALAPAPAPALAPAPAFPLPPVLLVEEVANSRPGKWVALAMLALLLGLGVVAWVRAQPPQPAPAFIPAGPESE